jgi:chromosome segregation ATPase
VQELKNVMEEWQGRYADTQQEHAKVSGELQRVNEGVTTQRDVARAEVIELQANVSELSSELARVKAEGASLEVRASPDGPSRIATS